MVYPKDKPFSENDVRDWIELVIAGKVQSYIEPVLQDFEIANLLNHTVKLETLQVVEDETDDYLLFVYTTERESKVQRGHA